MVNSDKDAQGIIPSISVKDCIYLLVLDDSSDQFLLMLCKFALRFICNLPHNYKDF